jgi:hypothetical protein
LARTFVNLRAQVPGVLPGLVPPPLPDVLVVGAAGGVKENDQMCSSFSVSSPLPLWVCFCTVNEDGAASGTVKSSPPTSDSELDMMCEVVA